MSNTPVNMKPQPIEEMKLSPLSPLSEANFERWKGVILSNILNHDQWASFAVPTFVWEGKSYANPFRGIVGTDAVASH